MEYSIYKTGDGSLTVEIPQQESMHNKQGALSESLFLYGEAIRWSLTHQWAHRFLSVGLGLAYNEMILACELIQKGIPYQNVYLESFEKEEFILENFKAWLTSQKSGKWESSEWSQALTDVLHRVSQHYQLEPQEIKTYLQSLLHNQAWALRSTLDNDTLFPVRFSCLLYDAFSANSTPELWAEESLVSFLRKTADEHCVFSSYAAKGSLLRALRSEGFLVEARKGFAGKRQSTFAYKTKVI
jgi:hypothetical protein